MLQQYHSPITVESGGAAVLKMEAGHRLVEGNFVPRAILFRENVTSGTGHNDLYSVRAVAGRPPVFPVVHCNGIHVCLPPALCGVSCLAAVGGECLVHSHYIILAG